MIVFKMIALIFSLGIDTLMMSVSLGMMEMKDRSKVAVTFACAEALMPLVGLLIGQGTGKLIGTWASLTGGIALLGLAVWMGLFEDEDNNDEDQFHRGLTGWALLLTAVSISLDELVIGFSIGMVGVPILLTIACIALQALVLTFAGLRFGSKLKPLLGEWSEKLSAAALGLLAAWIIVGGVIRLVHS